MKSILLLIGGIFASSQIAALGSFNFIEDFDDNAVDANFTFSTDAGFSAELANAALLLKKSAGTGNGRVKMDSTFFLSGDFVASIDVASRPSNAGVSFVFVVRDAQSSLADVYFRNSDSNNRELWGIIFKPTTTQTIINNTATSATFRIRRVGNALYTEYSTGGNFVLLQSKTNSALAVPVTVGVIMIQEFGYTVSSSGSFDNLSIVADDVTDFVPPSLSMTRSDSNLTLTWPGSALDFVLESTDSLTPPVAWTAVTNAVISMSGQNKIEFAPPNADVFFRLRK